MPEPGITDRNFNRPTTDRQREDKQSKGPTGGKTRRRRRRFNLPGEYAELRLEDGSYAGEVLGPDFFGPKSRMVRQVARDGYGQQRGMRNEFAQRTTFLPVHRRIPAEQPEVERMAQGTACSFLGDYIPDIAKQEPFLGNINYSNELECASGNQANAGRLRFESQDDALDFARRSVEKSRDWLARNSLDFAKRYKEGEIEIVINSRVGGSAEEYDLVFFAIPFGGGYRPASGYLHMVNMDSCCSHTNGDDDPMIALSANPVECPDYIIPSLVRIETPKERQDIRWETFAIARDSVFEVSGFISNGKMNTIRPASFGSGSYSVHRLVECRSQPVDYVVGEVGVPVRERLGELDFVKLVNAVRIGFNETNVGFFLEEFIDSRTELGQVSLCSRDPAFRAIEWVRHG